MSSIRTVFYVTRTTTAKCWSRGGICDLEISKFELKEHISHTILIFVYFKIIFIHKPEVTYITTQHIIIHTHLTLSIRHETG